MERIRLLSDSRLDKYCSYCGGFAETRDHVPSRVLLDEPFPDNLPVVPCCLKCNQDFSIDEEYFAVILECIIHGTTDVDKLNRIKIKSILSNKESLRKKIENSIVEQDDKRFFRIEVNRFINVITKLAKGHVKFENSESIIIKPTNISLEPLMAMSEEESIRFFSLSFNHILPEVGSRSLERTIKDINIGAQPNWITVQKDNYKYFFEIGSYNMKVKIAIWNYLAVEVVWENFNL